MNEGERAWFDRERGGGEGGKEKRKKLEKKIG